jgi:hypothetical protein
MIPKVGEPVMICDHLTRFRWQRFVVATHTTSCERSAFTVDDHAGIFVDAHEHQHWRHCTAEEAKGGNP